MILADFKPIDVLLPDTDVEAGYGIYGPEGMELLGPEGMELLGAQEDYDAIYGVHGPVGAWEMDVDLEDEVRLGTTLLGAGIGAAVLALLLGGRSRLLAALGGAGGAVVGGLATTMIGKHVVTFKRVTKPTTTPTTTPDPKKVATASKDLEGYYW